VLELPDILRGLPVFPVVPGGKLPATPNGWKDASADPAKISEWLKVNPNWNWGVACGLAGLLVFDIDPAGLDWWHKLLERDPAIKSAVDRAFQVKTPRGGLHVYFKGEGPSTASRIAEGIDTRGGILRDGEIVSGGYVVLPGSKTDKGSYEALPGGIIAPIPHFISAIIPERAKTDTLGLAKNPDADKPRNVQWAVDLLKNYVASGRVSVQGAGGNNLAFQVAASILDKAISPGMCFDLMWEHWNPACSPCWDEWELETIIRNAAAYGEDTEGGVKGFQANEDAFAAFVGKEFEPPAPKPRERDKILPLHEYADGVRDPEWLIPGVLPATGTGMLYGDSGSYKSFLALDMALTLAYGIAGQWNAPPVKNDVLFMAGEGPVATGRKRWPAWNIWRGIESRTDHRFFIKNRVPFFTDSEAWEFVKQDLAEIKAKPALIVIDTMSRLLTGLDENSSKDVTMVTNFLEELSRYYECFVLVVHHTGKDQKRGARGSSVFYANLDVMLTTRKHQTGTYLRVLKQKDADVSDDNHYYKVKESGESIVLERSDEAPDIEQTAGKPRFDWASEQEIIKVLQEFGGSTSTAVVVQKISSEYGVEPHKVRAALNKNSDLSWLRPDHNTFVIPKKEYDL